MHTVLALNSPHISLWLLLCCSHVTGALLLLEEENESSEAIAILY